MPEMTPDDLARIRNAVRLRDRCVHAAVDRGRYLDIRLTDTQARVAFDAMEDLIRADEQTRKVTS